MASALVSAASGLVLFWYTHEISIFRTYSTVSPNFI